MSVRLNIKVHNYWMLDGGWDKLTAIGKEIEILMSIRFAVIVLLNPIAVVFSLFIISTRYLC